MLTATASPTKYRMSINHYFRIFKATVCVLFYSATTLAHAYDTSKNSNRAELTSTQAFEVAMKTGKVKGILIGAEAASIKASTHSTDATSIEVVKGEATTDDCQVFYMTLTQPNVPTRTGANAGDYVAKTKVRMCRDGRDPNLEVMGCSVGMFNCMPTR